MKKIITIFTFIITGFISSFAFAQNNISIIPEGSSNAGQAVTQASQAVSEVSSGGKVWTIYRDKVKNGNLSLGDQFASGILSWDSILDYCVYLARFLGEVALLVGALAIIFLGYKRITKNLFGEKKELTMIIVGLLIVIFAYVIVKLIWYSFIS